MLKTKQDKVGRHFVIDKVAANQLATVAKLSGVQQQQIAEDAIVLYFSPNDGAAQSQRHALIARLTSKLDYPTDAGEAATLKDLANAAMSKPMAAPVKPGGERPDVR
jgi:hypothetical protein